MLFVSAVVVNSKSFLTSGAVSVAVGFRADESNTVATRGQHVAEVAAVGGLRVETACRPRTTDRREIPGSRVVAHGVDDHSRPLRRDVEGEDSDANRDDACADHFMPGKKLAYKHIVREAKGVTGIHTSRNMY